MPHLTKNIKFYKCLLNLLSNFVIWFKWFDAYSYYFEWILYFSTLNNNLTLIYEQVLALYIFIDILLDIVKINDLNLSFEIIFIFWFWI
jgi:hypothetical protein